MTKEQGFCKEQGARGRGEELRLAGRRLRWRPRDGEGEGLMQEVDGVARRTWLLAFLKPWFVTLTNQKE